MKKMGFSFLPFIFLFSYFLDHNNENEDVGLVIIKKIGVVLMREIWSNKILQKFLCRENEDEKREIER